MGCNIFSFLKVNKGLLKKTLLNPNAARSSKMFLNWMGKQIEKIEVFPRSD